MKRATVLVLVGITIAATACSSTPSSSPNVTSELNRINNAVAKADSAHFTDTTKIGSQTEIISGSASASSADESLSVNGKVNLQVLKVDGVLYIKDASASALAGVLGIAASVAPKYTATWISVNSSDKPYANLRTATTLASELHAFLPTSKGTTITTVGPTTVLSQDAAISSSSKRHSNLSVITASALPISGIIAVTGSSGKESKSVTLSQWGKALSVSAPSTSVSLASILG